MPPAHVARLLMYLQNRFSVRLGPTRGAVLSDTIVPITNMDALAEVTYSRSSTLNHSANEDRDTYTVPAGELWSLRRVFFDRLTGTYDGQVYVKVPDSSGALAIIYVAAAIASGNQQYLDLAMMKLPVGGIVGYTVSNHTGSGNTTQRLVYDLIDMSS